ncbi:MAG TPA: hypothetical protein VFR37_11885 [Longimicrobium sp.]|nr:hypothetical protein [Longimicrobium sp.]
MDRSRLEPLASPVLLGAVAVLVVNDWVLKPAFHNALTGKLSDVAGVAAFALFWAALFPRRRPLAFWMTAVAFAAWKSPLSQPLIDGWNALGVWRAGRVVDWTDLLALAVLPLVYRYDPRPVALPRLRRAMGPAVAAACVLAFAATSKRVVTTFPMEARYAFDLSPDSLLQRMYDLRTGYVPWSRPPGFTSGDGLETLMLTVGVPRDDGGIVWVTVTTELARAEGGGSVLRPREAEAINFHFDPEEALNSLERQVIEPLRRNRPNEVHQEMAPIGTRPVLGLRILGPGELFSSRAQVHVFVAEQAYLALVEVTPRLDWHVIYPVEPADERLHQPGEQVLTTLCARAEPGEPVPPGDDVPACALARRMTLDDARRLFRKTVPYPCPSGYEYPVDRAGAGSLLLIAAHTPLRRTALEATLGTWCQANPTVDDLAIGKVMERLGVYRWAAIEHDLRR